MGDLVADWPREPRSLPAAMRAEAAANPGGSVAEIDGSMISDPDGYVPQEAIIGVFAVGSDGQGTGEFFRNPGYGTVRDDFTRLESPDHWLGWLPDSPAAALRGPIEQILTGQVPGSVTEWVKIVDEPAFLTTGVRKPDDPEHLIVRRAALAVPFALAVRPPSGRREILTGVLTWVAAGLDAAGGRRDRVWLDFGTPNTPNSESLTRRIYEIDAPCATPKPCHGLTCCLTLGARAHPSRLPVRGPGVRLAGAPGAE